MEVSDVMKSATIKVREHAEGGPTLLPDANALPSVDPVVSAFFHIMAPDGRDVDQINEISTWLTEHGHTKEGDMGAALRALRTRFGSETTLEKVYHYVRLRKQASKLTEAARAMEK